MAKICIIIILINLILLGGAAVFIAWVADRMKFPKFDIDQGAINGYNFTNDNFLSANFIFVVRSHNLDSKYSIYYDHLAVSVYHKNYSLAYQALGPYDENDRRDDIVFTAHPVAREVLISDEEAAAEIRRESRSGHVDLDVTIRASVMFEAKGWKRKSYLLKMLCSPVVFSVHTGKTVEKTNCDLDDFAE